VAAHPQAKLSGHNLLLLSKELMSKYEVEQGQNGNPEMGLDQYTTSRYSWG